MKVTLEMKSKLEQCKSAEEVLELAKKNNVSLTMEQSQKLFDLLQSENISDEMMEKVLGGTVNWNLVGYQSHFYKVGVPKI